MAGIFKSILFPQQTVYVIMDNDKVVSVHNTLPGANHICQSGQSVHGPVPYTHIAPRPVPIKPIRPIRPIRPTINPLWNNWEN